MTFDWFRAGLAGVVVIWRRPASFLLWCAVIAAALIPALLLVFALMTADIFRTPEVARWMTTAIMIPIILTGGVFVTSGIYRAVLHPEQTRLAYLRFGRAEARAFVVALMLALGFVLMAIATALLGRYVAQPHWGTTTPLGVASGALATALFARLAMVGPAMVDRGLKVGFLEGWRLGRGRWPQLAGMALTAWLIATVVGVAYYHGVRWYTVNRDPFDPLWMSDILSIAGLLVDAILTTASSVVTTAPGAAAYHQLRDKGAPVAETFD